MKESELTQEHLKSLFLYNPETGLFRYRFLAGVGGRIPAGTVAGSSGNHGHGYIEVSILGQVFKSHRLAFLYMTGKFPKNEVDHINRERADNRWCNLREATLQQNLKNKERYKSNTSGFTGVHWRKCCNKWQARIGLNGRRVSLGHYESPKEAAKAYAKAKKELHAF